MSTVALSVAISASMMIISHLWPHHIVKADCPAVHCECKTPEPLLCPVHVEAVNSNLTLVQVLKSMEEAHENELKAFRELQKLRNRVEDSKLKWQSYKIENGVIDEVPYRSCVSEVLDELDTL